MAKPADFFVGITDFFSILLPGAAMSFVLVRFAEKQHPHLLDELGLEGNGGYVAFLVAAYLLGHVIDLIGASLFDGLYDLTYANWKRSEPLSLLEWVKQTPARLWAEARHWFHSMLVSREPNPRAEDELLRTAKALSESERPPGVNTYKWTRSWTLLKSSAASTEIERLQANSKFFRAMVTVSAITSILFFTSQTHAWGWVCLVLAVACFFRFSDLRWKAIQQTYAFYIALHKIQGELSNTPAAETEKQVESEEPNADEASVPD